MNETTTTSAYVLECTCGHNVQVNASDREDAVKQIKGLMNKQGIEEHFNAYHEGEEVPSVAEIHAHIESDTYEV